MQMRHRRGGRVAAGFSGKGGSPHLIGTPPEWFKDNAEAYGQIPQAPEAGDHLWQSQLPFEPSPALWRLAEELVLLQHRIDPKAPEEGSSVLAVASLTHQMSRALFRYYDYHLFASFVTLMTRPMSRSGVRVPPQGCSVRRRFAEVSGAGWLAHAGLHGAVGGAWK